jgi:WD40 repeat protein
LNLATGESLPTVSEEEYSLYGPGWSPDGKRLALGGPGLRVYDAQSGTLVYRDPQATTNLGGMALAPGGKSLAVNSDDATFVLPLDELSHYRRASYLGSRAHAVAWSPDGSALAVSVEKSGVLRWDAGLKTRGPKPPLPCSPEAQLSWSADGTRLAAWDNRGPAVCHLESNEVVRLEGQSGKIFDLCWSPDGSLLAGLVGAEFRIWSATDGKLVGRVEGLGEGTGCVAWSANGNVVAAVGAKKLAAWDVRSSKPLAEPEFPGAWGDVRLALSPSGRRAAFTAKSDIHVWDLATGKRLSSGNCGEWINVIEFCRDETKVDLIDQLNRRILWDTDLSRAAQTQQGPEFYCMATCQRDAASRVANREADIVASLPWFHLAGDRAIYLWHASTGQPLATLLFWNGEPVIFSPEGHWFSQADVAKDLAYVAQDEDGSQEFLSANEFAQRYGWRNDTGKATGSRTSTKR